MVDIDSLFGLGFLLLLGLCCILGGVYQLYHVIVGKEEQLQVGGRFRFLFGFKEPTLTGKRLFWTIGGTLLVAGGLTFLGVVAFSLRSTL